MNRIISSETTNSAGQSIEIRSRTEEGIETPTSYLGPLSSYYLANSDTLSPRNAVIDEKNIPAQLFPRVQSSSMSPIPDACDDCRPSRSLSSSKDIKASPNSSKDAPRNGIYQAKIKSVSQKTTPNSNTLACGMLGMFKGLASPTSLEPMSQVVAMTKVDEDHARNEELKECPSLLKYTPRVSFVKTRGLMEVIEIIPTMPIRRNDLEDQATTSTGIGGVPTNARSAAHEDLSGGIDDSQKAVLDGWRPLQENGDDYYGDPPNQATGGGEDDDDDDDDDDGIQSFSGESVEQRILYRKKHGLGLTSASLHTTRHSTFNADNDDDNDSSDNSSHGRDAQWGALLSSQGGHVLTLRDNSSHHTSITPKQQYPYKTNGDTDEQASQNQRSTMQNCRTDSEVLWKQMLAHQGQVLSLRDNSSHHTIVTPKRQYPHKTNGDANEQDSQNQRSPLQRSKTDSEVLWKQMLAHQGHVLSLRDVSSHTNKFTIEDSGIDKEQQSSSSLLSGNRPHPVKRNKTDSGLLWDQLLIKQGHVPSIRDISDQNPSNKIESINNRVTTVTPSRSTMIVTACPPPSTRTMISNAKTSIPDLTWGHHECSTSIDTTKASQEHQGLPSSPGAFRVRNNSVDREEYFLGFGGNVGVGDEEENDDDYDFEAARGEDDDSSYGANSRSTAGRSIFLATWAWIAPSRKVSAVLTNTPVVIGQPEGAEGDIENEEYGVTPATSDDLQNHGASRQKFFFRLTVLALVLVFTGWVVTFVFLMIQRAKSSSIT